MGDAALTEAYNAAVGALRRFRDAHLRMVALYIISPAHRNPTPTCAAPPRAEVVVAETDTAAAVEVSADQLSIVEIGNGSAGSGEEGQGGEGAAVLGEPVLLRGTGGTDMVRFLKGVSDRTSERSCVSSELWCTVIYIYTLVNTTPCISKARMGTRAHSTVHTMHTYPQNDLLHASRCYLFYDTRPISQK